MSVMRGEDVSLPPPKSQKSAWRVLSCCVRSERVDPPPRHEHRFVRFYGVHVPAIMRAAFETN